MGMRGIGQVSVAWWGAAWRVVFARVPGPMAALMAALMAGSMARGMPRLLAGVLLAGTAAWAAGDAAPAPATASPKARPASASAAKPAAVSAATPAKAAASAAQVAAAQAADAAAGFQVAPPPAWVQRVEANVLPPELPRAPVQLAVFERQTRLSAEGTQRFVRAVRVISEPAGLEPASQIEIEFDPSYQRLTLHRIELWRAGQRIDLLDRNKVKLLHREPQLERQMIDGRMTASLVLADIRVGDRIDWAYTLAGDNPVFGGRFVEIDWTQGSLGPAALYQYRLLAPPERQIRHQIGDASVTMTTQMLAASAGPSAGMRETVFQRRLVPQFRYDPVAPGGVYLKDQLQLSEFADWAEVARWAETLFASASQPGPEVLARAAELRARFSDPGQRLRAALDLVQTEVRYFGTEIGANSHQPAAADAVLKQRFGDCKDKVALLKSLLQGLDLPTTPLLVSTRYQRDVAGMLPSPLAFDHAIAGVTLAGKTLWLDGTRSLQSGPPDQRQPLGLGFGLMASATSTALVALPAGDDSLRVDAEDTLRFGKLSEDVLLEARQTFLGDLAEMVRGAQAGLPAADFNQQMAADHNRLYPSLVADGPATLTDAPDRNAVTVVQRFRLVNAWKFAQQRQLSLEFALPALMSALRLPDQNPRTQALRLAFPGIYRQSVVFKFSEPVFGKPSSYRFDDGGAQFKLSLRGEGTLDSERLDGELRVSGDRIEAADWARHRDALVKIWPRLGNTIVVSALTTVQAERLRERFAALDDDIKRGRVKASTPVQRDALARLIVLDDQIGGDRLTPKLKAEALIARGQQLDHLGRLAQGQADFEQAIRLDPLNADAPAALAVNALLRRDDASALAQADAALRLAPSDTAPRYTAAFARYFQGEYALVQQSLQQLLTSRTELDRGYAQLWLFLAVRRQGGDGVAATAPFAVAGNKPAWPHPVLSYLTGRSGFDDALAATREDGKPDPGRLCELYFYAGQKALIDGDARLGREYLQKALDTGVIEFNEYPFARRTLDALPVR